MIRFVKYIVIGCFTLEVRTQRDKWLMMTREITQMGKIKRRTWNLCCVKYQVLRVNLPQKRTVRLPWSHDLKIIIKTTFLSINVKGIK